MGRKVVKARKKKGALRRFMETNMNALSATLSLGDPDFWIHKFTSRRKGPVAKRKTVKARKNY